MELSVVRIHKTTSSGSRPWVQARSIVQPDKYLSQCPFILLNEEFYPSLSEFPIRAHDGVVAMTLVLEGSMQQTDGTGNRWRLEQGDADFSTDRGGVVRAETAEEQGVRFLHLWVNMPPSLKPNIVQRQIVRREHARGTSFGGANALIYAGLLGSALGPYESPWPLTIVDISAQAGTQFSLPLASTERSFAYILSGAVELGRNEVRLSRGNVAWIERTLTPGDMNLLRVRAVTDTRILFISGPVIGEHASGDEKDATEGSAPPATMPLATSGLRSCTLRPEGPVSSCRRRYAAIGKASGEGVRHAVPESGFRIWASQSGRHFF
jgi:redox-sensitive bicupin YhaK (pirin superfamily)